MIATIKRLPPLGFQPEAFCWQAAGLTIKPLDKLKYTDATDKMKQRFILFEHFTYLRLFFCFHVFIKRGKKMLSNADRCDVFITCSSVYIQRGNDKQNVVCTTMDIPESLSNIRVHLMTVKIQLR